MATFAVWLWPNLSRCWLVDISSARDAARKPCDARAPPRPAPQVARLSRELEGLEEQRARSRDDAQAWSARCVQLEAELKVR